MRAISLVLLIAMFFTTAKAAPVPCENTLVCELGAELVCGAPATAGEPRHWNLLRDRIRLEPSAVSEDSARWDAGSVKKLSPGVYHVRLDFVDKDTGERRCQRAKVDVKLDRSRATPVPAPPTNCARPNDEHFHHLEYFKPALARLRAESGEIDGTGVTVAVLDTGIHPSHPDFKTVAPGWDFVHGSAEPYDDSGHGTRVAGLVAGARSGLAPGVRLMPVKVLDIEENARLEQLIAGIRFAVDQGANIINISVGTSSARFREPLTEALEYANSRGVVVVVAAGNQGRDIDEKPFYPASLRLPNLITVGALDAPYSNRGTAVSVFVPGGIPATGGHPGQEILSTHYWPSEGCGSLYSSHFGTSLAAPLVAGYAALIKSAHPEWSPQQIKARVIQDLGGA